MREVKRQKEKGKRAGDELCKRIPSSLVKIRAIRVSHPCLSVCLRGLNSAFKIKNPPHNAGKIVKASQGESSVFDPPGGLCPGNLLLGTQNPLFSSILPLIPPSKQAIFTRKNRQFMAHFPVILIIKYSPNFCRVRAVPAEPTRPACRVRRRAELD